MYACSPSLNHVLAGYRAACTQICRDVIPVQAEQEVEQGSGGLLGKVDSLQSSNEAGASALLKKIDAIADGSDGIRTKLLDAVTDVSWHQRMTHACMSLTGNPMWYHSHAFICVTHTQSVAIEFLHVCTACYRSSPARLYECLQRGCSHGDEGKSRAPPGADRTHGGHTHSRTRPA